MKIAYINADFDVSIGGNNGASVHWREMISAFCREGHAVWVISPAGEAIAEEGERNQGKAPLPMDPKLPGGAGANDLADAILMPVLPHRHHLQIFQELETLDKFWGMKMRLTEELRRLLYNLALYEKALNYLRPCRIDCIYERYSLFSHAGIRLAKTLGVPHLLEVNAPLAHVQQMHELEMKTLACETERRVFFETDRVVAVSRQLQDFVITYGIPMGHISVLPNAVDPQRFDPRREDNGRAVRAHYQLEGKCVIGFVGSLQAWQGVESLIAAFYPLHTVAPNTHLLIVGDGAEREKLEQYAQATGLRRDITFTGKVPYGDVPHYIAAMDIAVAPYKCESFYHSPMSVFEYMAMGKPVVASRIGQVEELIVHGETGLLYTMGSVAQLTIALAKLASNTPFYRRLGENARAWVQKERTWENNAQQVAKMASELIKKRSHVAPPT